MTAATLGWGPLPLVVNLSMPGTIAPGTIAPSTFRLTACLLAVLRLKPAVTSRPPRTCYPVVGQPSGAGVTPAKLRDLARPHTYQRPLCPHKWARIKAKVFHLSKPGPTSPLNIESNRVQ